MWCCVEIWYAMSCYLIHILYSILSVSFYVYRGRVRSPGVMHMLYSIMPSRSILIHISQVYILTSADVPHQSLGFGFGVCSCKLCLPSIMYSHWFAFHISHNISHLVYMSFDLHNVGFKPCMLYVISFLSSVFLYISVLCFSSRRAHHTPCVYISSGLPLLV